MALQVRTLSYLGKDGLAQNSEQQQVVQYAPGSGLGRASEGVHSANTLTYMFGHFQLSGI